MQRIIDTPNKQDEWNFDKERDKRNDDIRKLINDSSTDTRIK